jgi:Fe2+ or Zn2+ uptake regulation protein
LSAGYFNTTGASGAELAQHTAAASKQSERVVSLFREQRPRSLSPSEVHRLLGGDRQFGPLTSVRRSITDLTTLGVLERTTDKVRGPFGHREYLWKLRSVPPEQRRLL